MLVELAEAGQAVSELARRQAETAQGLIVLEQAGTITQQEMMQGLAETFLGHGLQLQRYEAQFDRVLAHYSKLRLRINENSARRMRLRRAKQAQAAQTDLHQAAQTDLPDN
jgi:hypothetical protein